MSVLHSPSAGFVVASSDSEVILAPPSESNPIPALPAALRIDNREQLLSLLQSLPGRQLLLFDSGSLRTLLLRQVLSDPHQRAFKGKKNWDAAEFFVLPRGLQIVGCKILNAVGTSTQQPQKTSNNPFDDVNTDDITSWAKQEKVDVITYFLRPSNLHQTINVAHKIQNSKSRTHHRVVFIPQATAMCHKILSNLGITTLPNVTIHRLQLDVFPLETDVLSLEYPAASRETGVEQTPSSLVAAVARSLLKIQDVAGTIPRVQAVGPLARDVVKKMMTLRMEEHIAGAGGNPQQEPNESLEDITAMMIIDRNVDMVTPMLTPLTYEGLLDDVVGIDAGFLNVNVKVIHPDSDEDAGATPSSSSSSSSSPSDKEEVVALGVMASDTLYAEVRDQHVEKFGSFLQNQARALQESHANFTNKEKRKDLDEIHNFVKQIPVFTKNLRSLTNHIHLAELVKATTEEAIFRERWQTERSIVEGELCYDTLEDLIATQYPPFRLLRLLVLQSICGGGIKSARFDQLRRDIVQTYGYDFLFVMNNLEKAGLLRRRDWMDSASSFGSLRKSLILINAEVDPVEPDDVSYVSSGYAPLSVRLLQTAVKGWKHKDEILTHLPGNLVDVEQHHPPEDFGTASKQRRAKKSLEALAVQKARGLDGKKPVLLVVYVGGVTYMEIAALRFLNRRASFPYHILVLTTKIVSGNTFLQSLV